MKSIGQINDIQCYLTIFWEDKGHKYNTCGFYYKRTTCICPPTKLASFLFKERRLSQASLELSSSRGVFGSRENKGKKREKREKQNLIRNIRLYLQKQKTYKNYSPPNCCLGLQNKRGLYRPPQYMKIPKSLPIWLS